jgi:response regulator NasT
MEQISKRRIVVAEDESLIRMDIIETLKDQGFDVVGEAGDGLKAIALAKELRPDLIVMDIKMPDLDGLSAAEQIAELRIPVVFLTAFNQQELVARASEVGAMAFLVKPFSPEDLLPAIEIAMSRHQQLTQLESEVSDLTERLETRKLVERAKGVLGVQMGLSEPDAFRWIQKAAMDRRIGMVDVAKTILDQLEKLLFLSG